MNLSYYLSKKQLALSIKTLNYSLFFILIIFLSSCKTQRSFGAKAAEHKSSLTSNQKTTAVPLQIKKEVLKNKQTDALSESGVFSDPLRSFRGVWVATVANIDWPKNPNDSFEKKQQDYINLLKFYKDLHFNAVIVQIRTAGDAFYPTELAPWSKYLTGQEGAAPNIPIDPLEWLIKTTHDYGMDFHAWINPYRATMSLITDELSQKHDFYKHQDWMLPYGKKYYYNPGIPEVSDHIVCVVQEIVKRYEVDGIHLDDYFYPYKIAGQTFNDQKTYEKYGSGQEKNVWRRSNINRLIKDLSVSIKQTKPWVSFGVSPFGVWKNNTTDPKGSATRAGQTTYDDLYADPLLWMEKGWIDYLAPQLYWSMDYDLAAHKTLIDWWVAQKSNSRIYIGNGPYKIYDNADKAWGNPIEIANQLDYAKEKKEIDGHIFFSAKSLMNARVSSVVEGLKTAQFSSVVLPPLVNFTAKNTPFKWNALWSTNSQGALLIKTERAEVKQVLIYQYDLATEKNICTEILPFINNQAKSTLQKISYIKGINRFGELSLPIKINRP
jgi:uncharacterized lipoprotein YddW (UPF0748 family)